MEITFYKYQGTGNDFVMIDNRKLALEIQLSVQDIAHMCDRRFGIGADGLILLSPSEDHDFRMIYYNADGRESSMCGNGGRCIAAFASRLGLVEDHCSFEAIDGLHEARIGKDWVELKMGQPHGYQKLEDGAEWIDTGSPHYVRFLSENIQQLNVHKAGSDIRYSEAFKAEGTNVNFVNVLDNNSLKVRTYERGVEGETLSCGTGVTACAYIHRMHQVEKTNRIHLETEGGMLEVRVEQVPGKEEKVFLCGPALSVFEGKIEI